MSELGMDLKRERIDITEYEQEVQAEIDDIEGKLRVVAALIAEALEKNPCMLFIQEFEREEKRYREQLTRRRAHTELLTTHRAHLTATKGLSILPVVLVEYMEMKQVADAQGVEVSLAASPSAYRPCQPSERRRPIQYTGEPCICGSSRVCLTPHAVWCQVQKYKEATNAKRAEFNRMEPSDSRWDALCDEMEKVEDAQVALELRRDRSQKQMRKLLKRLPDGSLLPALACACVLG